MQILIDFCDPHGGAASLRCAFGTPQRTLVAHTVDQVKPVLDAVADWSARGLWCVGYLRYEAAKAFDAALAVHDGDGPLAWFGVYAQPEPWPDCGASVAAETRVQWQDRLARSEFDAKLARIHQAIAAGEFYQLNYTAALSGEFCGEPLELFARLQRAQPDCYAAYIDTGMEQVLSVSPELFFDWRDAQILTRPMKGTAARGLCPAEDDALAAALVASPKERAENVMIVDLLRNDLSRIAQPFSVKVPALFTVQTLPTVFQMVSDVTATTRAGTTLSDVFGALFPCGSVTGAPKVQAMRSIQALEPQPRGVYCGAIGVVRPGGHATFNVAIRTVTLRGNAARCGIGSGITADATAPAEWQEWQHKRGFLERASESFELLETLRLENQVYPDLIAHIARMTKASRHFGYKFDENKVRQTLQELASGPGTWRVRLLLNADGQARAETFALAPTPTPVRLALATRALECAHSEFVRFKTTRRAHYDAFASTDPAIFDTLLFNAEGELTECTRGNIALLLGGRWVTPPLHCGLLGGVGRARYLESGRLSESVVQVCDLPRVQALAFINSLRGWVDARLG